MAYVAATPWIEPIYDRTQADTDTAQITQSTTNAQLKGALDYRVLNRIEKNVTYIRNYLLYSNFPVQELVVKTNWTAEDSIYISEINRIIENVNILINAYVQLSEISDLEILTLQNPLDYVKINQIEYVQFYLDKLINNMVSSGQRLSFVLGRKTFGTRGIQKLSSATPRLAFVLGNKYFGN